MLFLQRNCFKFLFFIDERMVSNPKTNSNSQLFPQLTTSNREDEGHSFAPGDNVEVCEGELMNLMGRVTRVDGKV